MPEALKIRAVGTDARAMTDTAVTPTNETATQPNLPTPEPAAPAAPDGFFLDGDVPRLGSAPLIAPAPLGTDEVSGGTAVTTAAPEPEPLRFAEQAPLLDETDIPTLPTAAPEATPIIIEDESDDETDADPDEHPMAHLMPSKSKPTEASMRAAELRAEKKAKAKKIKIGMAIGALVVSALAGPPLFSWLSNAVNEVGVTEQSE